MVHAWIGVLAALLLVPFAAPQSTKEPGPELERVVQALAPAKQSGARMLLARSGGSGRKVILEALADAGKVSKGDGPAKAWTEQRLKARLKAAMPATRWKTFSAMLAGLDKAPRALLLEMLRVRIDLPAKRLRPQDPFD